MPTKQKAAHHRGTYHVRSRALVAAAYADPTTRCQSPTCKGWGNRTLHEHPLTKQGNPPRWSAGHVIAGQVDGPLQPEVLGCNAAAGGVLGNRSTKRRKGAAWRPPPPIYPRTEHTW